MTAEGRAEQLKIMVVEDDPTLLGLHTSLLESFGYKTNGFLDAQTALTETRVGLIEEPPRWDMLLTDNQLGDEDINGHTLAREFQRLAPWLPRIMVTGDNLNAIRMTTEGLIDQIVPKPYRIKDLKTAVEQALEIAETRRP